MSSQTLLDAALVVLLVGFMLYRQMSWRPADTARMIRMPIIMFVVGLFVSAQGASHTVSTAGIAILAGEIALSLAVGAVMGSIAHFRPLSDEQIAQYANAHPGRNGTPSRVAYETRTGWFGIVLWVLLIAVRIGIEIGVAHLGVAAVSSTGAILIVLAANRFARAGVLALRVERHRSQNPRVVAGF